MQAAIFKGNGILEIEERPVPKIKFPNQVLLKVHAASICGSDIHALHVPPGQIYDTDIIIGHEFFGTIVEKGTAVKNFDIGDCVAVNPCLPCGECWECKHNMRNLCQHPRHYGQTCDGGFADYAVVESSQIYHLPKDIIPEIAAQTEPLACCMYSLKMVNPSPSDHILLYGAGPIGLTFEKVLLQYGVKNLAVVAKGDLRIQEAKKCGATFVIDCEKDNVERSIRSRWSCGADIVIDAVGRGSVLEESIGLTNSRGRILLFGLNHNAVSKVPPAVYTQREITMMGSLGKDFPAAIELIRDNTFRLDEFVTHRLPLKEVNHGFDLLRSKEACRVILFPEH
ncbi:MAG: zinc-dependent alcohol dehydrogenase [Bilifractor sp.]|jgi:threonine dehydrogenase-like Zn-dependent dehydrogenase